MLRLSVTGRDHLRFLPGADPVSVSTSIRQRSDGPARRLDDELPRRWILALAVAWPTLLTLATAIEPVPADETAVPGALEQLVVTAVVIGLAATVLGLLGRSRWGALASLVTAVGLVGMSIACPGSGHHEIGAWWFAQLAMTGTLVGLSYRALRAR